MIEHAHSERKLVLPAGARLAASGLGFTEGPALLPSGEVGVASINRGTIYAVDLEKNTTRTIAETGGGPNCLAAGLHGEIWVTQNGGTAMASKSEIAAAPSIQKIIDEAVLTVHEGDVSAPSDCIVDDAGRLWFTDPAGHTGDQAEGRGTLRIFDPHTATVTTVLDGLRFPNGLCFGTDPGQVYVAETLRGVVRRYRFDGTRCEWDGWQAAVPGGTPDGIALDSQGWLWVAGGTGDNVVAFDPSGRVAHEMNFGTGVLVTSVCFAGRGLTTLIITVAKGGSVVAIPALHPGEPLVPFRSSATVGGPQ
ncbi:SMP-30/Gluconolaconase/LRE-like region-containing protein [Rhodococcus ruber BKS 20-38]|uniref:SMP-30/Gluconolaconase/LRE-like region-containing protein n=1 Tax=Rhodococcus ruber BKS 20-38 TaxID=1278076 RepID=M2Y3S5_9NOCA|nr:SMP-30/gluconolactonase/LRE family protein [Rhodococcus ruber]EME56245.1 SMP-30/Gluconolaconase/LRE-like region-containing protein [Rhodococcus ruber BKS 20-38]